MNANRPKGDYGVGSAATVVAVSSFGLFSRSPKAIASYEVINRPENDLKENGNEKEKIPLHPLKSKSKGKRNKTGML